MKTFTSLITIATLTAPLVGCVGAELETKGDMTDDAPGALAEKVIDLAADAAPAADDEFKHCIIEATAVSIDQIDIRPASRVPQCFRTFSQAIEFATSGRVRLPIDITPENVDEDVLNSGNPTLANGEDATVAVGIGYEHTGFNGASVTFTTDAGCTNNRVNVANEMPSGWNDRISSARAFSGCNHSYHYEHTFLNGAVVDCGTSCANIGPALNDRTSSIRWTH